MLIRVIKVTRVIRIRLIGVIRIIRSKVISAIKVIRVINKRVVRLLSV